MQKKNIRLYNLLFPVWLLIWIPSWLWLVIIPANYLIDYSVLFLSLTEDKQHRKKLCHQLSWKICLAGFAADLLGSLVLFGLLYTDTAEAPMWWQQLVRALAWDLWHHAGAVGLTVAVIMLVMILIYFFDRKILQVSLGIKQARRSALMLAVLTAPYFFLLLTAWIYRLFGW
ncbi:hypothetical protein IJJ27_01015 [bacterium]|nr:hypothetical protein [bacterium]